MKPEEVLAVLEKSVATVKLSDEFCAKYKTYDNSGIIINCGNPVSGVLFSLDLSQAAVERALQSKYNLIVTHHPAIYGGISRFDLNNNAQSRALALCLKHGISVISMHLNFDAAQKGIDYYLMKGLGGENAQVLCGVTDGGYGRVYAAPKRSLKQFIADIKEEFNTDRIICHGESADSKREVSKVASFCGAGCDDNAVEFAKENGADVLVSSDLSHHRIAELVESGITVIQLTHYSAECYGFKRIYEEIKGSLDTTADFFFDERFA